MRFFLLALVTIASARAQEVMDIVHTYSAREASRLDRSRDYTYQNDLVRRIFKRDGTLKSATSETIEVLIVNGKPVRKLTRRNGIPVTEQEARKRQQQLERMQARARSAPDVEDRYDTFKLEGEEEIDGRRAWVVSAKKSFHGIFRGQAKFWIDEVDHECAKLQTEGTMNLIAIDGRAHAVFRNIVENMRVADGVWLPKHTVFRSDGSIPLTLFPVSIVAQSQEHRELESTFSNYKKFQADSRILTVQEP